MNDINTITLSGRLVKDIEITRAGNGMAVANFTLGQSVFSKGKENSNFIDCVAYAHQAEYLANVGKKGTLLFVNGFLQKSSYKNKQGQTMYSTKVVVNNVVATNGLKVKEKAQEQPQEQQPTQENNVVDDDGGFWVGDEELPF